MLGIGDADAAQGGEPERAIRVRTAAGMAGGALVDAHAVRYAIGGDIDVGGGVASKGLQLSDARRGRYRSRRQPEVAATILDDGVDDFRQAGGVGRKSGDRGRREAG